MLVAKNSDAVAEEKRQAQSSTTVCDEDTVLAKYRFVTISFSARHQVYPSPVILNL